MTYLAIKLELYLALLVIVDGAELLEGWHTGLAEVIDKEVESELGRIGSSQPVSAGEVGPHARSQRDDADLADVHLSVEVDQVQVQVLWRH